MYVVPGPKAARLSRLSRSAIDDGAAGFAVECTFPNPETKTKKPRKKAEKTVVDIDDIDDVDDDSDILSGSKDAPKKVKKEPGPRGLSKMAKSEPRVDEHEPGDFRDMSGWDEPFEDDDEEDNVFGKVETRDMDGIDEASDSDPGSSERENGWKVVKGRAGGRKSDQGGSKSRAIILSD